MDKISELLQYVHRTNPEMTRERLIEELSKSDYAARSLIFTKENHILTWLLCSTCFLFRIHLCR